MAKKNKIKKILPHESGVRRILADIEGAEYHPLESLEEARKFDDAYAVFEGDWGGQVFLSIPVTQIKCDYSAMKRLLSDLGKMAWECNEGIDLKIYFERSRPGELIPGGMGGGRTADNLWVHDEFCGLEDEIKAVFNSEKKSIDYKKPENKKPY